MASPRKVAVITGASSGIGRELAYYLDGIKAFDELWITGRDPGRLEEVSSSFKSAEAVIICADLASEEGMSKFMSELEQRNPEISFLANCAGTGYRDRFEDQSDSEITETVEVNCVALSRVCHAVLPHMQSGARIMNIASSAGFLPQPGFAVYAASKSYVISLSKALSFELKDRNIKVTCVCTGPVNTDFRRRSTRGGSSDFEGFRAKIAKEAGEVAERSYKASLKGRRVFVYGFSQKMLHIISKIIPHSWLLRLIK